MEDGDVFCFDRSLSAVEIGMDDFGTLCLGFLLEPEFYLFLLLLLFAIFNKMYSVYNSDLSNEE